MSDFVTGGGLQATGGLLSSLVSTIGNSIVTNRQNKKNRNFQAQQAQIQRDWQEDMYNKYSSPSAMVKQYQEAGLNPALAYGNPTGQTFSGGTPAGGSTMQPDWSGANAVGENLINLLSIFADIELKKEQAESEQAGQDKIAQEIDESKSRVELNSANINLMNQKSNEIIANIDIAYSKLNPELNILKETARNIQSSSLVNEKELNKMDAIIKELGSKNALNEQQRVQLATVQTYYENLAETEKSNKKLIDTKQFEQDFVNKFLDLYGVYPTESDWKTYSETANILGNGYTWTWGKEITMPSKAKEVKNHHINY